MTITVDDVKGRDSALDEMIKHRQEYGAQLLEAVAGIAAFQTWCEAEHLRLMQAVRDNDVLISKMHASKSVGPTP